MEWWAEMVKYKNLNKQSGDKVEITCRFDFCRINEWSHLYREKRGSKLK